MNVARTFVARDVQTQSAVFGVRVFPDIRCLQTGLVQVRFLGLCHCYYEYPSMNIVFNKSCWTSTCTYLTYSFLECAIGVWGADCTNICDCSDEGSVTCDNVRGCVCKPGYTGISCAVDVDECEHNPNICGDRQLCVNTIGSYRCVCQHGFVRSKHVCIGNFIL